MSFVSTPATIFLACDKLVVCKEAHFFFLQNLPQGTLCGAFMCNNSKIFLAVPGREVREFAMGIMKINRNLDGMSAASCL